MTKGEINPAKTRSKIGHHRVLKEEDESLSLFFVYVGLATVRPRSRGRSVGGGVAEQSLVGDDC